jgi:hypothetical protein
VGVRFFLKVGVPSLCGATAVVAASALADPAPPAASAAAPSARAHTIDVSRVLDAGALRGIDIAIARTPVDPMPLVERSQWVFDFTWDRGDVWLRGVSPLELVAPQPTPRAMGRFALELFEGPTLVERVRFDFPLLGVPDFGDGGWSSPPPITQKIRTRIGVVFPATRRGTRMELVDRASNRRWSVPWPPQAAAVGADD